MKTLYFLLISLFIITGFSQSQTYTEYPKILEVFCSDFEKLEFSNIDCLIIDNYVNIGNYNICMDPDDRFNIYTKDFKYNICSVKEIFFYDYKSWVLVFDCNISDNIAQFSFDLIINETIIRRGTYIFKENNSKWEVKGKLIDKINIEFNWTDKRFDLFE